METDCLIRDPRFTTNMVRGAVSAVMLCRLQTTNSGMGIGVSSAVSRALGAGRRDRANDLVFHAFLLALALAAVFSTVMPLPLHLCLRDWSRGSLASPSPRSGSACSV